MKKEFLAFVSLGFGCNGPEMGDYGKFNVDLTEDEISIIDKLVADKSTKGYKRNVLAEQYPTLDGKIRNAGQDLVERISLMDVVIMSRDLLDKEKLIKEDLSSGQFQYSGEIDFEDESLFETWEKWEDDRIMTMPSKERFSFVKKRYGIEDNATLDDICGELCYYLSDEELPNDYQE